MRYVMLPINEYDDDDDDDDDDIGPVTVMAFWVSDAVCNVITYLLTYLLIYLSLNPLYETYKNFKRKN